MNATLLEVDASNKVGELTAMCEMMISFVAGAGSEE
jgi:hypothetical protein